MADAPRIELIGLCKSFASTPVIANVSMQLHGGNSHVLLGESGVGKSVVLKCILGLLRPDQGSVLIDGRNLSKMKRAFLDRSGVLFQGGALFDSLPVWQNITFRKLHGSDRLSLHKALMLAEEKLERVGLGKEVARLFPVELSGGMQKRVALARAIAFDPEFLFFDEPTSGLDPIKSVAISRVIRDVVQDRNVTALTVTHDMNCVRAVAEGVTMLRCGKIYWEGGLTDFVSNDNAYISKFSEGHRNLQDDHR